MTRFLAVLLFALVGCSKPPTNERIIDQTNQCKDAGMDTEVYRAWDGRIERVACVPKEAK
jgi:hypothetical protein